MLNASDQEIQLNNVILEQKNGWKDVLNGQIFTVDSVKNLVIPPNWIRIIVSE